MKNVQNIIALTLLLTFVTLVTKSNEVEFIDDSLRIEKPHVLIVTNRMFADENIDTIYFPNKIASNGSLTYLIGHFEGEKLLLQNKSSFDNLVIHKNKLKNWLVYVHGDSKTLADAAQRAFEIQEKYKVNVIVYSWPSKIEEGSGLKNFKNSRLNVETGIDEFLVFLSDIEEWKSKNAIEFANNKVSIMFHSLGNYYLERLVKDDYIQEMDQNLFDNLVVNAAAVNQKDHHSWLEEINIQERIYVNSNGRDFILRGVRLLTDWNRQLGEALVGEFASNATYVDFTNAVKNNGFPIGEMHGYYLGIVSNQSENIRSYYHTIFHGKSVDLENEDLFSNNSTSPVYNINL